MQQEQDWLANRLAYIRGLKHPTKQQELLLLLGETPPDNSEDEKTLRTLIKAEKAVIAADKAKADVTRRLNAAAKAADKQRTHELIQSGLLMVAAGLVDKKTGKPKIDRAELVGALTSLAKLPPQHERRSSWRQEGQQIIDHYEQKKKTSGSSSMASESA